MTVEEVRYWRSKTNLFSTFLRSSSSILSDVWYKYCTCTHEMQVNYNLLKISFLQTGRTAVENQSSTAKDKKSTTMLINNNWNNSNIISNVKITGVMPIREGGLSSTKSYTARHYRGYN